jgi:lipopolysaccharide/colanic/teichoic acid biosynthesis glycosyltransferase
MARHNVKCGITGWAQVNGLRGSDTSIPHRIQYDLYYLRNWSMTFDVKIIFLTIVNGLVSRQAY